MEEIVLLSKLPLAIYSLLFSVALEMNRWRVLRRKGRGNSKRNRSRKITAGEMQSRHTGSAITCASGQKPQRKEPRAAGVNANTTVTFGRGREVASLPAPAQPTGRGGLALRSLSAVCSLACAGGRLKRTEFSLLFHWVGSALWDKIGFLCCVTMQAQCVGEAFSLQK